MSTTQRWLVYWISLVVMLLWYATGSGGTDTTVAPAKLASFTIPAALAPIMQNYRGAWRRLTNFEFSGLHWNQSVVIYMNKDADVYKHNHALYKKIMEDEDEDEDKRQGEVKVDTFLTYSPGTIIVKENHVVQDQTFSQPKSVTVMMKQQQGYDPAMGDWRFIQFDTCGKILVDGNSQVPAVALHCAFCHRSMAERDYVFSTTNTW